MKRLMKRLLNSSTSLVTVISILAVFLTTSFLSTSVASAAACGGPSTYYRFWQGYKRADVSPEVFLGALPGFMQKGVELYQGKGINNYLVGLPPYHRPDFVPDEFALLGFESEELYSKARSGPEGQLYADAHWEIFDQQTSKSAPMTVFSPGIVQVEPGVAYDVFGHPIDLCAGVRLFQIGLRKDEISAEDFRAQMAQHIALTAKNLQPLGLVGYLVLTTNDYSVAYLIWKDQESLLHGMYTPEGRAVFADADRIMNRIQLSVATEYLLGPVYWNKFYSTFRSQRPIPVLKIQNLIGTDIKY